jgi:hypothetical protein
MSPSCQVHATIPGPSQLIVGPELSRFILFTPLDFILVSGPAYTMLLERSSFQLHLYSVTAPLRQFRMLPYLQADLIHVGG